MLLQERVLKYVPLKTLTNMLLYETIEESDKDAVCLAIEYRMRVKNEKLQNIVLRAMRKYVERGIELRKMVEEDTEMAGIAQEIEECLSAMIGVREVQQAVVNATTHPTPGPPTQNLGSKEYCTNNCNTKLENKTSRVKHVPTVLPNVPHKMKKSNDGTKSPQPSTSASSHTPRFEPTPSTSGTSSGGKRAREEEEEDIDREFTRLEILDDVNEYFDKFNIKHRKLKIKLKTLPPGEDFAQWIYDCLDEVCRRVKQGIMPGDLVCLTISNDISPERPIFINARLSKTLVTDVILNSFQKVCQSNQDFLVGSALNFEVHQIEMPKGGGGRKFKYYGLERKTFITKQRSFITVKNEGENCLGVALVLAKSLHELNVEQNKKLQRYQHSLEMTTLVDELLASAGVDLSRGGGIPELEKLQDYLTNYRIIVYGSRDGKTKYYTGKGSETLPRLNLYLEDGHYSVIKSVTGAFGCERYCLSCNEGVSKGHICEKMCMHCRHTPKCESTNVTIICNDCNRKFKSHSCFKKHKLQNKAGIITCDIHKQCLQCDTSYKMDTKGERVHVCHEFYCKNCNDYKPYDHLCHITPKPKPENFAKLMDKVRMVFFDLECTQNLESKNKVNTFMHEANLCVSQQVCNHCINNNSPDSYCGVCGPRTIEFYGGDVIQDFIDFLVKPVDSITKTICIAHNGGGYDFQFLLRKFMVDSERFTQPKLVLNGMKIISMEVNNIKIIDSLNFIPMSLAKIPAAFGIKELHKGYFPYLFNTVENQNYSGKIPALEFFSPDSMTIEGREKFMKWYEEQRNSNTIYNFKNELFAYCKSDVNILREGCMQFRKLMLQEGNIECFIECNTLASACNLVFRRNFLNEGVIGLVPKFGYRWRDNQSKEAIEWLVWKEHEMGVPIKHAGRGQEMKILGRSVDGYLETLSGEKIIYQYHGCWFHGCKKCYGECYGQEMTDDPNDTLTARRERTDATKRKFIDKGYTYVEKWGCDFNKERESNPLINEVIKNNENICDKYDSLSIRDSFKGGRTNAVKMYHLVNQGEKIRYKDFTSLYPYINKYKPCPIGHPQVFLNKDCPPLENIEGFCYATVLPPKQLFFPVLPYTMNNKLLFFLCKKCAETCAQVSCKHTEEERMFKSTFASCELKKAVEMGYKIIKMHECWHYETSVYDQKTKTGGVFAAYISMFSKLKVESSGYPIGCDTPEQKQEYIDNYERVEGIRLDANNIVFNAGKRLLAKLLLNCLWGKFGQRNNLKQHIIISSHSEMYAKISEPGVVILSFKIITSERLLMIYEYENEAARELNFTNLPICAYTTAHARLHLYKYLEVLGVRCLYFDTDSFIYLTLDGVDVDLPSGVYLGELTNELEGYHKDAYITEFVSGGPKNYAYKVRVPGQDKEITVHKVKGITLNHGTRDVINLDKLKDLVIAGAEPIYVVNPCKITRTANHEVVSVLQSKMYRIVYGKRRIVPNSYNTLPFGYVDNEDL